MGSSPPEHPYQVLKVRSMLERRMIGLFQKDSGRSGLKELRFQKATIGWSLGKETILPDPQVPAYRGPTLSEPSGETTQEVEEDDG